MNTHSLILTPADTNIHTYTYTETSTYTLTHTHTNKLTHSQAYKNARIYIHKHLFTLTYIY